MARKESRESGEVLHEISFTAEPGQMVALVGPSGAGKTTVTHLVARLYDATTGVVRVGGHDVRDVTLQSLEDTVGYVTQDAHMFHDTIRENLLYAHPAATDDEIWAALAAAQIAPLIRALPDGLDTVVGDRGYRLSGGERQRLAIARLLLKAPSIVVLDEATAHLDSESEVAVQRALDAALAGRTSLVIAHRLSTVRHADLILVVESGRIVQRGTHAQLLAAGRPLRRPLPHPVPPRLRALATPVGDELSGSPPWTSDSPTASSSSPAAPAGWAVRRPTSWWPRVPGSWSPVAPRSRWRRRSPSSAATTRRTSWPTTPTRRPRPGSSRRPARDGAASTVP